MTWHNSHPTQLWHYGPMYCFSLLLSFWPPKHSNTSGWEVFVLVGMADPKEQSGPYRSSGFLFSCPDRCWLEHAYLGRQALAPLLSGPSVGLMCTYRTELISFSDRTVGTGPIDDAATFLFSLICTITPTRWFILFSAGLLARLDNAATYRYILGWHDALTVFDEFK